MKGQGRIRPIVASLVALAIGVTVFGRSIAGASSPPDFQALLKSKPYLRLFTESNDCSAIRAANQLTGTQLDARIGDLTRWFVHFHSEGSNTWPFGNNCKGTSSTTLAEKLGAEGAIVTNYRNGSYVSQANQGQANWGEAEMLERTAPLSIGTFWPGNAKPYVAGNDGATGGRLAASLTAGATTVRVTTVASDQRPSGTPATWPFVNSRGTGTTPDSHTKNTHDVVSWLRVDDELMQIVGEPTVVDGVIEVPVFRGLWGTGATSHAATARVFSPVYIGSSNAASSDSGLNGAPSRNETSATLRYGIKIWQQEGWRFIADRISATFAAPGLQGYNGVWLDVSSCNQYNNADWHGNPIFQWNDAANEKFTREAWGAAQKTKLAGLRSRFPGVWFSGNSLGTNDACTWDLLANAYDGGPLEHYMKPGEFNFDWNKQIDQTFRIMQGNWPALFWVRWNYAYNGNVAQYKRFAYGNVLLAYRAGADRYQFGGPFGLTQPDEIFRWDLGAPEGAPASPAELRVAGTNLYRREYENAVVLVNPSASPITYPLGTTLWDVTNKDASGDPKAVTSVTVGANDATFLLKPASDEPGPSPSPAPSPSPSPDPSPVPENQAPDTAISAPATEAELPADTPVVATGTATDDAGVAGVEIAIRDVATGEWWRANGSWGTWQGHAATVDAPGSTGTTWAFTWKPPTSGGTYELRAVAIDGVDLQDPTVATRRFTVDALSVPSPSPSPSPTTSPSPSPSASPTVDPVDTTVATPKWNAKVKTGSPLRVSGSASDDVAVASVGVAIKDTDRNVWYRSNGTWGAWDELDATLDDASGRTRAWTFEWTPPRDGEYLFIVRARDPQGHIDTTPAGVKMRSATPPDTRGPKTRILEVAEGTRDGSARLTLRRVRRIIGVAYDDRALREVRLAIRDRDTGRWLASDGGWVRNKRWSLARLADDGGWVFPWRVRGGRFRVIARAVDAAGNMDPTPAEEVLRVG